MFARRALSIGLLTATLLVACAPPSAPPSTGGDGKPRQRTGGPGPAPTAQQPGGGSPTPTGSPPPAGTPTATPGTGLGTPQPPAVGPVAPDALGLVGRVKGPAGLIANNGGGVLSNNGGALVSNNSAGLIGANGSGIVSDSGGSLIGANGSGLVSNNSGSYRLLAVEQVPVAGVTVELRRADGSTIMGPDGKPITARTAADGSYTLPYKGGDKHVFVVALVPGAGQLVALVPRGETRKEQAVEVDLASTLAMGYVIDRYVRVQKDPVAVIERLPAELAAATTAKMAEAVAKAAAAPPRALVPSTVVDFVERLRGADPAIDTQLEDVKKVLLAGLSDIGAGQPVDSYEADAGDVAVHPITGEVHYAGLVSLRVWKRDAAGKLAVVAGSGLNPIIVQPEPDQPAPGDGGPAIEAFTNPAAIAFTPQGTLLIAERNLRRVREVGADGVIKTRVAHADWNELRDMALEPDGSLVLATHSAVWRVAPAGQPTLIAGEVRAHDALNWPRNKRAGDGGPPAAARFINLFALSVDPLTGDVLVYDGMGTVRRIGKDKVEAFAGGDAYGFSGDGGPATAAKLNLFGGVLAMADGRVLISDAINHRLRAVENGTITTIAGTGEANLKGDGGPATAAGLLEPTAMSRGPDGSVYFVDQGYVRRLAQGKVSTVIGGTRGLEAARPAGEVQLLAPSALSYDAATHSMLVADDRHVWHWDLAANTIRGVFGRGPAGESFTEGQSPLATNLFACRALLREPDGSFLLSAADPGTFAVYLVRVKDGKISRLAGGTVDGAKINLNGPLSEVTIVGPNLHLVKIGDWYYYNIVAKQGQIRRFQLGGNVESFAGYGTGTADGTLAKDFDFALANVIAQGPDGALYVGDVGAIYRIDMATTAVTRVAGAGRGLSGDGGPALDARFSTVAGIAWDAAGNMYFSDGENACVRRIDKTTGVITRVAGESTSLLNGKTVDTGLSAPYGLAFDKHGDLYICDTRHGQVKVIPKSKLP